MDENPQNYYLGPVDSESTKKKWIKA